MAEVEKTKVESPEDSQGEIIVPGVPEEFQKLWRMGRMGPVDGIYLPAIFPGAPLWSVKVEQLRNMKLRDDDVFLFTYPKAGTHWLWEVMSMIQRGSAESDPNTKVQFMMEFVDEGQLNSMPSPRIFNTHLPLSFLPLPEVKARRLKLVHVYRNPKSTCVSLYHMAKSIPQTAPVPTGTFEELFNFYFFSDKMMYGNYFDYLKKMHEFQQQNPQVPALNIAYEDVKKEPAKCVKKIADFMGKELSDEVCSQIAEACSFDNMKKQHGAGKKIPQLRDKDLTPEEMELMKNRPRPNIYRKGEIADWKNYFTVAMSETVDQLVAKETKDLPFTFTFE